MIVHDHRSTSDVCSDIPTAQGRHSVHGQLSPFVSERPSFRFDSTPANPSPARRPSGLAFAQRRSGEVCRRDDARRGGPGDADRRVVAAQAARLAGNIEPADLAERVGRVFEGQKAVGAAGRDQQRSQSSISEEIAQAIWSTMAERLAGRASPPVHADLRRARIERESMGICPAMRN